MASESEGSLQITKAGIEKLIYTLAFKHPFIYGVLAVVIAVLSGRAGWFAFRRD